jgi:hypothetical protein
MIMRKITYCLSIVLIFGCQSNMQKKIVNKINQQCKTTDTCIVRMSDVTDFEWEKMYVFNENSRLEEINKLLGFNYEYFEDVARRIIFTKSNKVVYHEDDFPYPEESPKGKVFFKLGNDTLHYRVFLMKNAVFKTERKEIESAVYYELTPLE